MRVKIQGKRYVRLGQYGMFDLSLPTLDPDVNTLIESYSNGLHARIRSRTTFLLVDVFAF